MSVVCGPPIVSCDPLSRILPKELYLPLLVITAHKEQHNGNMSYLSARRLLLQRHKREPLKAYELYGNGCHVVTLAQPV